jgi:hypothetical protein
LPDNPLRLLHVGRLVKWKRGFVDGCFAKLLKKFPIAKLAIVGTT